MPVISKTNRLMGREALPPDIVTLDVVPTLVVAAYAAGDVMGTDDPLVFPQAARQAGGGGWIFSAGLIDLAKKTVQFDLFLWHTDPSNSTFTDNLVFDPADADEANAIPQVIKFTDYADGNDNQRGWAGPSNNFPIPYVLPEANENGDLYGVLVARGAYTPDGVSDLKIRLGILRD